MEDKNVKRKNILTVSFGCLFVVVLALAISYAVFKTTLTGKEQVIKVGSLELVLNETSTGISLDSVFDMSDEDAQSLTPATFTLVNNGTKAVSYTLYLDDNTISSSDVRMEDKFLKFDLVKNNVDMGAKLLSNIGSNPNRVLDSGTIASKGQNSYSLSLWITNEVDGDYANKVFSGKLRVVVTQEKKG